MAKRLKSSKRLNGLGGTKARHAKLAPQNIKSATLAYRTVAANLSSGRFNCGRAFSEIVRGVAAEGAAHAHDHETSPETFITDEQRENVISAYDDAERAFKRSCLLKG